MNTPCPRNEANERLKRTVGVILVLIALIQVVTILRLMRPPGWLEAAWAYAPERSTRALRWIAPVAAWMSDEPIIDRDYSFHFYNSYARINCMRASGRSWGYDPFWYAGYPIGVLLDIDNIGASNFSYALSFLSLARSSKLFVFLALLAVPLLAYPTARALGLGPGQAVIAGALALFFWNTYEETVNYQSFGMVSFLFAAAVAPFVVGLYVRFLEKPSWLRFLPLALCAFLYFPIHVLSPLLAGLPIAVLFFANLRAGRRVLVGSLAFAGLVVLLNLYWVAPMINFFPWLTESSHHLQPDVGDLGKDFGRNNWYSFVILFGCAGLYLWGKGERKKLALAVAIPLVIYLYWGYFGSLSGVASNLQPKRFKVTAAFLLVAPAAFAIHAFFAFLFAQFARKTEGAHRTMALLLCVPVAALLMRPDRMELVDFFFRPPYYLTTDISSGYFRETFDLSGWIKANTSPHEHILVEDWDRKGRLRYEVRDNARPMLAVLAPRPYIGRYDPPGVMAHTKTNFLRGNLFGYAIGAMRWRNVQVLLKRYQVDWIIAYSEESKSALREFDELKKVEGDIGGKYTAWRYEHGSQMKIEPRFNELRVTGAPEGEVTLPYHWCEGLATEPAMLVSKHELTPDPVPLIRVHNGKVRNFKVFLEYR